MKQCPNDDLRPQDWRFARNSEEHDPNWLYPPPERGDLWVFITAIVIGAILVVGLV